MKRILSCITAVLIALTSMYLPIYAVEKNDASELNGDQKEAMTLFTALDIAEDGAENVTLTREDFAFYLAKLLNVDVYKTAEKRYFKDLSMTSYGTYSVNALTDMNVISRNDEGEFRPDDAITLEEASKMLCAVTGYTVYAEAHGGYPTGYLQTAKRNKFMADVADANALSLYEALEMMYKAARIEMYEVVSISAKDNTTEYKAGSGNTLLSLYHNVYFKEGTVNGAYGASAVADITPEKGTVTIDDTRYLDEYGAATPDMLGEYVEYFYKWSKSDSMPKLIAVVVLSESVRFSTEDLISFDGERITYYENDGEDKRTISLESPVTVYNGSPVSEGIAAVYDNLNKGYISIKDMDDDGKYDMVMIDDYATVVVSYTDEKQQILYDKLDIKSNVSLTEYDVVRIVNESGNEIGFSDISKGDVLSITKSKDKSVINIIRVRNTFNGTADVIKTEGELKVTIGDTEYEIDDSYDELITDRINAGSKYYWSLDVMGDIVYVSDYEADRMNYAYVIDAVSSDEVWASDVKIKLATENKAVEIFTTADRVRVDGKTYKEDAAGVLKALKMTNEGKLKGLAIRYTLNSDGKISDIDTPYLNTEYETEYNSMTSIYADTFSTHYSRANRLGLKTYYDSSTVGIGVPSAPIYGEVVSGDVVVLKGIANDASYTSKVYTTNVNNEYCNFVAYEYAYSDIGTNNLNNKLMMVDSVSTGVNSDGAVVSVLKGYSNGAYTEYVLAPEIKLGDITQGDIVKLHFDYYGTPIPSYTTGEEDVVVVYDYSLWKGGRPTAETGVWKNVTEGGICRLAAGTTRGDVDTYYARCQLSFGFANERVGDMVRIGYASGADFDEVFKTTSVKTIVYDKNARSASTKIYAGTVNDIVDYKSNGDECSGVLIQTRDMDAMCLWIYK